METTEEGTTTVSAPPQAIVFFGDRLVELADVSGTTLSDLCEAFGIEFDAGTCIQERESGRVVATLPYETLPAPSVDPAARKKQTESFLPRQEGHDGTARPDGQTSDADEDGEATPEPGLFDLVVASAPAHDAVNVDEEAENEVDPLEGVPEALTEAAKRLVKMGAVGLLSEEPEGRVAANPYVTEDAPGLLKRVLYADEVYCPYRTSRDPLHISRAVASKVTSAHAREQLYGNEKPYWATLDSYNVPLLSPLREDVTTCPLFFGCQLSEEQHARLFASL